MNRRGKMVVSLLCWLGASGAMAAACAQAEYRAFDFWLGSWDVFTPDGKRAGRNDIKREYDGCVIHERYATPRGYRGESLNAFDAGGGRWHQSWVDNTGTVLLLSGGLRERSMVLEGDALDQAGKTTHHRITWTPNADGSVRQLWESSDTDGKWTTVFDGTYRRR